MAGTILFVDDESDLRFMVATYFDHFGLKVITAADADEAMRVSQDVPLGAIILDVNLPGKGSAQLLEFLKKNHPRAPIILYTGRQEDDDLVTDMLRRGASRYLLKDGSLERLVGTVKDVCP